MTDNPIKPYVTDKNGTPIESPFRDIRMRKAVSHAINRTAISERVMDGLSSPAGQFSPKGYIGVTKHNTDLIHAGDLIKIVAEIIGGKGGGRPDFAQAGGPEADKLDQALEHAKEFITSKL